MLAYKFLRPGAVGPFSGFAWPVGPWVTADARVTRCRAGIHGCRAEDLPWWLQEELWVAELADPVTEAERKVVASRARLVARVDAWNAESSQAFADACARRAREHAAHAGDRISAQMATDGARRASGGHAATAAYIAAHVAHRAGGAGAMAAERRCQSDWLAARLGLG
jgi:hypothetical protein